jgi:5-methylcytosine-specific restriction endonuclease McrA
MLNSNVLLLNHNFVPLTVCTAKRAIVMVWSGKAEIIESTGQYIHSVSLKFDIPLIIRLLIFVKFSQRWNIQLTKQNIMKRDHGICQYCGKSETHMTIDHVIPRSHGGHETWDNLVCACPSCNNMKGDRTPHEAGMELLRKPVKPTLSAFLYYHKAPVNSSWMTYLKIR